MRGGIIASCGSCQTKPSPKPSLCVPPPTALLPYFVYSHFCNIHTCYMTGHPSSKRVLLVTTAAVGSFASMHPSQHAPPPCRGLHAAAHHLDMAGVAELASPHSTEAFSLEGGGRHTLLPLIRASLLTVARLPPAAAARCARVKSAPPDSEGSCTGMHPGPTEFTRRLRWGVSQGKNL